MCLLVVLYASTVCAVFGQFNFHFELNNTTLVLPFVFMYLFNCSPSAAPHFCLASYKHDHSKAFREAPNVSNWNDLCSQHKI